MLNTATPAEGAGRSIDHARVTDWKPPATPLTRGWFSGFDTFSCRVLSLWEAIMAIIGYARVSTTGHRWSNNSSSGGVRKIIPGKISGARRIGPQLQTLLEVVRSGDMLKVTKLDRLARNTRHLLEILNQLHAKGVIANPESGIDTATPTGKLMLTMIGAIATFEAGRSCWSSLRWRDCLSEGQRDSYRAISRRRWRNRMRCLGCSRRCYQSIRCQTMGISVSVFTEWLFWHSIFTRNCETLPKAKIFNLMSHINDGCSNSSMPF